MSTVIFEGKTYVMAHGSPFDRGCADYYYWRKPEPHKWLDSMGLQRVVLTDQEEIAEYNAGYAYGEYLGDRKNY